jgi:hypothetical protein
MFFPAVYFASLPVITPCDYTYVDPEVAANVDQIVGLCSSVARNLELVFEFGQLFASDLVRVSMLFT